mmetsp:Transcript_19609/g.52747  ORF Transcript_19609/g.52747 Transcript_19609/m.52747 type:complete len:948 (+) Transcript_19609:70-2913(+)
MHRASLAGAGKKGSEASSVGDDEFLEGPAAPLAAALLTDPSHREAPLVQQALDWWLQSLPALGVDLAPELNAPGDAMLNAFRRGRFVTLAKGEKLHSEGEEIRHYSIILLGRCRLRCRAPAPTKAAGAAKGANDDGGDAEEAEALRAALDEDGAVLVGTVGRGEPIGLLPGDLRAPWEAVCSERTAVLLLGAEDYAATLRPYHRELQAQAVQFLQQHNVCPQGTPYQLQKFAALLRQRRVRRGTVLLRAGEYHRSVLLLREGSCSLFSPPQERPPALADAGAENEEELAEEEAAEKQAQAEEKEGELQRLERLRHSMHGADKQQKGAADEARNAALIGYARGSLGKAFRGEKNAKPHPNLGVAARKDGLVATAKLSEPGLIIGEEVLLYDNLRDLVVARNCYTAMADEDCALYVLDLTAFQKLASLVGAESVLEKTREKMARHLSHHTRSRRAASQVTKETRRIVQREMHKQDRQTLRLPPSYEGADPLPALEDTNDWLQVVYNHRRAPRNDKNPDTLLCLQSLNLEPLTFQSGPGTGAMLQVFNNPAELKTLRSGLRWRRNDRGRLAESDRNPMGEFVQKEARYEETLLPGQAALAAGSLEEGDDGDEDSAGGIFFQTELDEGPAPPPAFRAASPSSGPAALAPRRPGGSGSGGGSGPSQSGVVRSSSVPALPRLADRGLGGSSTAASAASLISPEAHADTRGSGSRGGSGGARASASASRKGGGSTREAAVAKIFYRAIVGKSILVLTDRADSRKSIMRGLQTALTDFSLVFVKSVTDLWKHLNNSKEHHHALIIDLSKNELQADPLLQTIRHHGRYSRLPILVLSSDRELSDTVRVSCSFVVFQPIAASMLREGLLWCLDRQTMQAQTSKYEASSVESQSQESVAVRSSGRSPTTTSAKVGSTRVAEGTSMYLRGSGGTGARAPPPPSGLTVAPAALCVPIAAA